jgi:hypothetical protein
MQLFTNYKSQITNRTCLFAACCLLLAAAPSPCAGDSRHEPLTQAQIDELRDVAQQPEKRLPLYVKFIRERADNLDQLFADPRFQADRMPHLHGLLQDIDTLVQELDDNIDSFARDHYDLRKPLKEVIAMDRDLGTRLRAIQQKSDTPDGRKYEFVLRNAVDSVDSSLENAQKVRQEQEEAFKNQKKK